MATLVLVSFLVLAAPIHADDTSREGIAAAGGESTTPVDDQPPAGPGDPVEDDEGRSQ